MDHVKNLNNMHLFAKVVDHGGFTAAAKVLGLQTSKLSRRITALEAELGVRLLNRTSRRISLTDAGRVFHLHCVALVGEAQAAKMAIDQTRATPHGVVRISCPFGLSHARVAGILSQYLLDNLAVRIVLEATQRRVDVVEEGFDIAVRVRALPLEDSELVVLPLATSRRVLVASPGLLAQFNAPAMLTLNELSLLPTLAMANASEKYQWRFLTPEVTSFSHVPRLATDDLSSLREAALRGVGVAQLPFDLVRDDLAQGRLSQVLQNLSSTDGSIHAVFPSRRGMVPAVRGVLDALVRGFKEHI